MARYAAYRLEYFEDRSQVWMDDQRNLDYAQAMDRYWVLWKRHGSRRVRLIRY